MIATMSGGGVHTPGSGGDIGTRNSASSHVPGGKVSWSPSAYMPCEVPSIVTLTLSSTGAMVLNVASASVVVGDPIPPAWLNPSARLCSAPTESTLSGPLESLHPHNKADAVKTLKARRIPDLD